MREISGTTRLFPVIGWPVEQVKAPTLFNAYFNAKDIDARVVPFKVSPERYCAMVRALMDTPNIGGIFVSIPHKPMTIDAVDEVTPRAKLAGACNAIYKKADGTIVGDLIDGEGFVRALDRTTNQQFSYATAKALVVGTGGVGRAIAAALMQRGVKQLTVYDNRPEQAAEVQQRLMQLFPGSQVSVGAPTAKGFDLVVNSTPLGMHPDDPMPIDLSDVSPNCVVADCGMKVEMTKLLQTAQAAGCPIQKGKEMMIEQSPLYLELFGWEGVDAAQFRALEAL